jgi:cell division septation protein DedD
MFGDGVHIKIDNTGKETVYRVMIGRYQEAEHARPLVGLLKEQGIEGFVKEVKRD